MSACRSCGEDVSAGARFCSACGRRLDNGPIETVAYRTITVVYGSVTAAAAAGEPLPPDGLSNVRDAHHAWVAEVVSRHGGRVQRHTADSLVGLFGAEGAREDDAWRAVRAAQELHTALPEALLGTAFAGRADLRLRTAVHTGRASVSDHGGGARLVTGEAIDTAAALLRGARAGDALLSDSAYRLVRHGIEAELVAPVAPHVDVGAGSTTVAWRVIRIPPEQPDRRRRITAPFIGRTADVERLLAALARARDGRIGHLFTLVGSAGIGKSRLLEEFLSRVPAPVTVLRTRCVDVGSGMSLAPLADLVRQVVPAEATASLDRLRTGLVDRLGGSPEAGSVADTVLPLLTAESGAVGGALAESVQRMVVLLAARNPTVVVIEDLQWAGSALLDVVARLGRSTAACPVVMCRTARPEFGENHPGWGEGGDLGSVLVLEPLSEGEIRQLVDLLLSGGGAEDVRARVAAAADGNPLYAEEIVAMLVDDGLLARVANRWVAADLVRIAVPPTVSSLLTARLDRLPRVEARLLQQASVIGRLFYRGALAALSDPGDRAVLDESLRRLVERDLISPEPAPTLPDQAFRFRHLLLRETAYSSLLATDRADLHERCAGWVAERGQGRLVDYDEIVGYHYEQACRYRIGLGSMDVRALELATQAAARLTAAGRNAFARRDMPAAAGLLSRAAALLFPEDGARVALLPDLAAALVEVGELRRAERLLDEGLAAAIANEQPTAARRAREVLRVLQRLTRPEAEADDPTERAQPTHHRQGGAGLSGGWSIISPIPQRLPADAAVGAGSPADAFDPFGVSLVFDATPAAEATRFCLDYLAQPGLARTHEARLRASLAGLAALEGRIDDARTLLGQVRLILTDLGLKLRTVAASYVTGLVELLADDALSAESVLAPAFLSAKRMGDHYVSSGLLALRARAAYAAGRYGAAEEMARAVDATAAVGDHVAHALARGVRGMARARAGEPEAGVQLAQEALWTVEGSELLDIQGHGLRDLAETLFIAGRHEESRAVLAAARTVFLRKGDTVMIRRIDRWPVERPPAAY